ncbi:hypothetical protein GIY30_10915 [Gordonia sp. HNM0687]|uniref:Uncharacterized protein n=1 Tax=Gordonia mangrovi TaxID=2665643 RepID=A0A6L7GPP6_9ACTN|nr:IniB N-terminal domain-containing protein [Gordonia mangrovi]MXP21860.1 hypothetical protein [Gordonia mangrovi]UVF76231.1 IniB N-terminal domain-containing protein [Gordonia mangrovi]
MNPNQQMDELIAFIQNLFESGEAAEDFEKNPGRCLELAGLDDVTPAQVQEAATVAAQAVQPAAGGDGGWAPPPVSGGGSVASIIQNVTNNYYQQFNNTTIIGDNNTVDTTQTMATGDGSVAVGGNANGPIATTGGVAGTDNTVGNSTDDHSVDVDKSIDGDGSGNTANTNVTDNSRNDSHNRADVSAPAPATTPVAAPAPQPFHPAPIPVDDSTVFGVSEQPLHALATTLPFADPIPDDLVSDAPIDPRLTTTVDDLTAGGQSTSDDDPDTTELADSTTAPDAVDGPSEWTYPEDPDPLDGTVDVPLDAPVSIAEPVTYDTPAVAQPMSTGYDPAPVGEPAAAAVAPVDAGLDMG